MNSDAMELVFAIAVLFQFVSVTLGQNIRGPESVAVLEGNRTELRCEDLDGTSRGFTWNDLDRNVLVYAGPTKSTDTKYNNFNLEPSADSLSILSISGIEIEDEGTYVCLVFTLTETFDATVSVEVKSVLTLTVQDPLEENVEANFECRATGGRPQETISVYVIDKDGQESQPSADAQVNTPNTNTNLTDSVRNLRYAPSKNDRTMSCRITGHAQELSALNQQKDSAMNVQYGLPDDELSVRIEVDTQNDQLVIKCMHENQPNPAIYEYVIYLNSTDVISNSSEVSTTVSPQPLYDTEFTCSATNGVGPRTTASNTYTVGGATTPTATPGPTEPPGNTGTTTSSAPSTTPVAGSNGARTGQTINTAAIVGGVVGGILLIAIIVIVILYTQGCFKDCCSGSKPTNNPSNKVTTGKPSEPKAAPRNVEHRNDNPGQAEYAMVDKNRQSGGGRGDYADSGQNGKGQPDPGMHYADIDLSKEAGHTSEKVPQDKKDVVVYSSILV